MATLKELCQTALREIGNIAVPTTFVGNADPTAVQVLALANRVLKELQEYKWQIVLSTHTFTTTNGVGSYALPADFESFADMTQWDRANYEDIEGPVSPSLWEALRSSNLYVSGIKRYFRVAGGLFEVYPTPNNDTDTIAYQYYSNQPIALKSSFSDDADVSKIYEDLITLGIKYYWRDAKGLDSSKAERDYRRKIDSFQAKDGGKQVLRFGFSPSFPAQGGNIPDTGIGG